MSEESVEKRCPKCSATNLIVELPQREYRCGDCGLELAHLDTTAQGAVRGVLGWCLDVGTEINERYRVTAVLGKGGFGVTYLVDDLRLHGKHRALKEIPEILFDEHETRLLGRLSHPSIPDITDRFTESEMVYLVLEFGGNRTLRTEQERRGGRIPAFVLLPWVRQLCDALSYLHEQDPPVVHRDLKPDNVLLDDQDRVMLIDFGIAKEATQDSMTRTLGRAVSHGFSPPEQVLGTGTDARSDVYALGAITYNLVTGQMPAAAHERIAGKAIEPLSNFLPKIPPLIETAVMKALELNINLRQQSIAELTEVFGLVQDGSGSTVTVLGDPSAGSATGPTTANPVVLPSVQLPTSGSSATGSAQPSIRVAQPDSTPVPTPPKRPWATVFTLITTLVAVAGGGAWYLWQSGAIDRFTGSDERSVESARKSPDESVAGAKDLGMVAPMPSPSGAKQGLQTGTGAIAAAKPTRSTGGLPSVFSSDQPTVTAAPKPSSGGSLLDTFKKYREEALTRQPVAKIVAPGQPKIKPKTKTKKKAKPKRKVVKRKPVPKRKVVKRRASKASKPASSVPSSWGFKYKGATKH
ncbi:serine/threonine protein kinase [Candidatus Thiosymbion oneisti]|uniref:serine/threonine protein kinase n=1 Tax=Candidatus Thiosymbion oneisti TaxID=589554 RepID=UPI000A8A25B1|nr:protein kinase [Candidatus Thiosymbion oneisti]